MRNSIPLLTACLFIAAISADAAPFDQKLHDQKARTYSPEESMAMIEMQPGYKLELVAAEPMVEEPGAMAWDGDGKLYVAELNNYMQDIDILAAIAPLADDADIEVAIQLVLSLGRSGSASGGELIGKVLAKHEGNEALNTITKNYRGQIQKAKHRQQENKFVTMGRTNFQTICIACHTENGMGTPAPGLKDITLGAPLVGSSRVLGRKDIPIRIMLKGMVGPLDGKIFAGPMLPLESYDDEWIASVLTYVRNNWGNKAPLVTAEEVAAVRASIKDRKEMYQSTEILAMTPVPNAEMQKWKFVASHNSDGCKAAIDGNIKSRWDSGGAQTPGMWFAFDMGKERELSSIVLDSAQSNDDFPCQYSVEVSPDGRTWSKPIAKGNGQRALVDIILPSTKTRYVRIVQHGRARGNYWSIHQLEVYAK